MPTDLLVPIESADVIYYIALTPTESEMLWLILRKGLCREPTLTEFRSELRKWLVAGAYSELTEEEIEQCRLTK